MKKLAAIALALGLLSGTGCLATEEADNEPAELAESQGALTQTCDPNTAGTAWCNGWSNGWSNGSPVPLEFL